MSSAASKRACFAGFRERLLFKSVPKQTCHPDRTPESCYAVLHIFACAAFCKESRMKLVNAIELDRNPGAVEGSAVRLYPKPRPSE